ncbi:MAG: hypothetical protein DRO23_02645 [Thermoprotei archaeon]|nr:MAG: hypothetical protein DRO23_02645 [Thermoprotei archaeon]
MDSLGVFYGVLAAISFALSPIFYRLGSKGISVLEANSIRAILSLPVAYVFYVAFTGNMLPNMRLNCLFWGFILAFLGNAVGDSLFILSIKIIGPSLALALSSTYSVFTLIFSVSLMGETVSLPLVLGLLLVLSGVFTIYLTIPKGELLGFLAAILCAITWGFYVAIAKIPLQNFSAAELQFSRGIFLTLMLAPIALRNVRKYGKEHILFLTAGGTFGLVTGYYSLLKAVEIIGAAAGATITAAAPALTPIFSRIALREKLSRKHVIGILLTILGITLLNFI